MPRGIDRYDETRIQGRLWTPRAFRPALWFDAADLATIVCNAFGVSQWSDKSGFARHATQSVSGAYPTFVASGISRLPSVQFTAPAVTSNPSAPHLVLPNMSGFGFSAAEVYTVFVRNADPTPNEGTAGSAFGSSTAQSDGGEHEPYTDGNVYIATFSANRKSAGDPAPSFTSPRIVRVRSAASDWQYWVDGTLVFSTASNTFSLPTTPFIGRSIRTISSLYYYFDGQIAEMVIFGTTLSASERLKVEGYLAWKWPSLVANLPASNPFKSRPPLIGD